jgi:hypothetical protein
LILDDIAEVVYSPARAFKKIIENPKYLGAILVLILFIGLSIGYEYVQFSKIYTENTSPTVDSLPTYLNATLWSGSSNVSLTNNFADPFNYSIYVAALDSGYSIFGNSSLEMNAKDTNNMTASLSNVFNVDCSAPSGFQNLSVTIKPVAPAVSPKSATLTLYSLNDTNFYTYDLTSSLSSTATIGVWNSLTIPVGPNADGWKSSGSPSWGKITALQLSLTYPASSSITVRVGALLFRGQYQTPVKSDSTGLLLQFLQAFGFQFVLAWLLLTGLIYVFFKGLKATITWKPLFVALGFALFVMVIRAAINLVAAATLPTLYYPYDLSLGVRFNFFGATYYPAGSAGGLTAQSRAALNTINAATAGFGNTVLAMFAISYVWLAALCTIIVGTLKPEFSMIKRIIISFVSIGLTLLLLLLLVGFV